MSETVVVRTDFGQYHLLDSSAADVDFTLIDDTSDAVLAPIGCGVSVIVGQQWGPLPVTIDFREQPPAAAAAGEVAAEVDFPAPSGRIELTSFGGEVVSTHDFGPASRLRVRVTVHDRDTGRNPGGSTERHEIVVWPVETPTPRWRSGASDVLTRHHDAEYGTDRRSEGQR